MANRWGSNGNSKRLYFGRLQNHCRWWLQPWNLKTLAPWKKSYDQPRQYIKNQRHYFASKAPSSQSFDFSSSPARRSNQSILNEISPEYSLEGLMLKLNLQYKGPPDMKSRLIGKDPDIGKDWGKEKGMTENEMIGWHHQLNEHEFEQTLGDSEG